MAQFPKLPHRDFLIIEWINTLVFLLANYKY